MNTWYLRRDLRKQGTTSRVKVAQSCPILCDPRDYKAHGILQARILEGVAFPFSWGSSQSRDQTQVSHIAGGFFTRWALGKPPTTPTQTLPTELGANFLPVLHYLHDPTQSNNLSRVGLVGIWLIPHPAALNCSATINVSLSFPLSSIQILHILKF